LKHLIRSKADRRRKGGVGDKNKTQKWTELGGVDFRPAEGKSGKNRKRSKRCQSN